MYIRGSKVRFMVLPDMLKNAPMFKKASQAAMKGKAAAVRTGREFWLWFLWRCVCVCVILTHISVA